MVQEAEYKDYEEVGVVWVGGGRVGVRVRVCLCMYVYVRVVQGFAKWLLLRTAFNL